MVILSLYVIYFHIDSLIPKVKIRRALFQTFSGKVKFSGVSPYCASVNFRLNPKFVLDVGKVFATNGLFIS